MIDKFLIKKYGAGALNYSGFIYIRDIIENNKDYIINTTQTYKDIADKNKTDFQNVERNIRYFKEKFDSPEITNTSFLNNLIFEYKSEVS